MGEPWLKLVGSPARGAAGQLVDAKAWLLCLSLVTLWGFPFETGQWRSLILLVCQVSLVVSAPSLWSQHGSRVPESRQPDTCTREETLMWAATHERKACGLRAPSRSMRP